MWFVMDDGIPGFKLSSHSNHEFSSEKFSSGVSESSFVKLEAAPYSFRESVSYV